MDIGQPKEHVEVQEPQVPYEGDEVKEPAPKEEEQEEREKVGT